MKNSICKSCGNQFHYNNKGRVRKFCSTECYRVEQRKGSYTKDKKIIETSLFLEKAKEVHGDKYKYIVDKPIESNGIVEYICAKHGLNKQLVPNHLKGHGCKQCGHKSTILKQRSTNADFINASIKVHGDTYDYSDVNYTSRHTTVKLICKKHGAFYQTPSNHLSGKGCRYCGIEKSSLGKTKTQDYAIAKLKSVHGDRYCYKDSIYTGADSKIKIKCPDHGFFYQTYTHHAKGHGCKACFMESGSSFSRSRYIDLCNKKYNGKSNLYVLRCFNDSEEFYKVGITCGDIKYRYAKKSDMPYNFDVIHFISGEAGAIWNLEKSIHRGLKNKRHKPKIYFCGETECFKSFTKSVKDTLRRMSMENQMVLI